jgi:hypothetical protein
MPDSAVLDCGNSRVVLSFAGHGFEGTQLRAPAVSRKRPAEITAGKEPAKRLFFRESIFARERKQQSLKEETWQ